MTPGGQSSFGPLRLTDVPSRVLHYTGTLSLPVRFRRARRLDGPLLQESCFSTRPPSQFRDSFERALQAQASGQRLILVAETRSALVGTAQLVQHADRVEIADLVVAPAFQNQRIGTALISVLTRVAAYAGFHQIEIGVMAGNKDALKLYQRLGFALAQRIALPDDAEALVLSKPIRIQP